MVDKDLFYSLVNEQRKIGKEVASISTKMSIIEVRLLDSEKKREQASKEHAKRFERIEKKIYYLMGGAAVIGAITLAVIKAII